MQMQHRMPTHQYGGPMGAPPFGAAPFGMPPPGFQPFAGYGPPQAAWGTFKISNFIQHEEKHCIYKIKPLKILLENVNSSQTKKCLY